MPFQENKMYLTLSGSGPESDLHPTNVRRQCGECLQLEWSDLDRKNTGPIAESLANPEVSTIPTRLQIKDCFVVQSWHVTYAQALIATAHAEQASLAAEAEKQILARYLELAASHISTGEASDLVNALDVLKQIRNAAK
jgi:hypothetical protein